MTAEAEVPAAARAVVADDGTTPRLILYRERQALAVIELDPMRALRLAGELIAAALPKLRNR